MAYRFHDMLYNKIAMLFGENVYLCKNQFMRFNMKYLVSIIAVIAMLNCNAAPATDSIGTNSTAITVVSDTVIDDTADYVISTSVPKGIFKTMQSVADKMGNDSNDDKDISSWFPFSILESLLGFVGAWIIFIIISSLLIPIALIVLVVWLLIRYRNKARKEDMRQNTPGNQPDCNGKQEETADTAAQSDNTGHKQNDNYPHRRDNAIRNLFIGVGILALSALLDITIGMVIGIIVLCVGATDYFICRNHRNENN